MTHARRGLTFSAEFSTVVPAGVTFEDDDVFLIQGVQRLRPHSSTEDKTL